MAYGSIQSSVSWQSWESAENLPRAMLTQGRIASER